MKDFQRLLNWFDMSFGVIIEICELAWKVKKQK